MLPSPTNPILCPESALSIEQTRIPYRAGALCKSGPLETSMKVIITGGGGFLGSQLAQKLLERGSLTGPSGRTEAIREIVLFDTHFPRPATDPRIQPMTGDMSDRD